jgi:L-2-hydroxyglutarate oxidase LhgO
VNFGEITRQFVAHLQTTPKFDLKLSSEVQDITKNADGSWRVSYKNLKDGTNPKPTPSSCSSALAAVPAPAAEVRHS